MNRFLSFFTLALFVFGMAPAFAASEKYEFDKAHTQILFFADHAGFSKSSGKFLDFDGYFMFDEENPENSSVEVTIKTESINMDLDKWDAHMKNKDFFDVEQYPEMVFKSTAIEVIGENTAEITGDLTMLGQTHPVTLQTTLNKVGIFPMNNKKKAGFSATTTLDRTQWGMNYGTPMMNPMVELRIQVEGSPVEADEK